MTETDIGSLLWSKIMSSLFIEKIAVLETANYLNVQIPE